MTDRATRVLRHVGDLQVRADLRDIRMRFRRILVELRFRQRFERLRVRVLVLPDIELAADLRRGRSRIPRPVTLGRAAGIGAVEFHPQLRESSGWVAHRLSESGRR